MAKLGRYARKEDVLNALRDDKVAIKEIKRVFQVANRRIQNIEKADLYSPPLEALGITTGKYTKFSVKGKDWKSLLREYNKAISFLNDERSTARGARAFKREFMVQQDMNEEEYKAFSKNRLGKELTKEEQRVLTSYNYGRYGGDVSQIITEPPFRVSGPSSKEDMINKILDIEISSTSQDLEDILNSLEGFE